MKTFDYNKFVSSKSLLKENTDLKKKASYLENLSPDEQTKLKEYVSSLKEIKKEIKELIKKAKSPKQEGNWGGSRKDMVMPIENEEER